MNFNKLKKYAKDYNEYSRIFMYSGVQVFKCSNIHIDNH